ncbi:MAG: hypothetical protein FJ009_18295 [Chloroflexi bacterium]|nr:hypothetical protein [Chloroflexota bacterium]
MRGKTILLGVVLLAFVSMAIVCGTSTDPLSASSPSDSIENVIAAQERATRAAGDLQSVARRATTIADATREAMVLQAQATRLAQDAMATQTTFNQRVQATVTAQSATSTAIAQSVQATRQSTEATATANAASALATQVGASATATANAANAQATQVGARATATVIAAQIAVEEEKAAWNQRLESLRAIASFVGVTLVLIAASVIVGFGVIRFIDAGVLRARVLRDKTGTVLVIGEKDQDGRQMVLIPGRSPGAAMMFTPPGTQPLQIEAGVVDEETTKRDQAISLMIAATSGKGSGADELLDELTEGDQIRIVDQPPPQIVSGDVRQLIDTNWKELGDGS